MNPLDGARMTKKKWNLVQVFTCTLDGARMIE